MAPLLSWFKQQRRFESDLKPRKSETWVGAEIRAFVPSRGSPLFLESGTRLALLGRDQFQKNYFCDWVLGFVDAPEVRVEIHATTGQLALEAQRRQELVSVLGRSFLLYGETIQENLLYRTSGVGKEELYPLLERFYGPSLKEKTNPLNPLMDRNGKPIPTQMLSAREHLEIASINSILQNKPILVLDLSSPVMDAALREGFRPDPEIFENGKTLFTVLPPERDIAWAENLLGRPFTASLNFD